MSVAEPRPAATVVVVREPDGGGGIEVLLVRRNDRVAFMAGAYVFPGGRVDDADAAGAPEPPGAGESSRFPDLTRAEEQRYRRAAVRELGEEAAVRVDADALVPFAHWVTPEIETRRYDTRFFLTRMPPGQQARHDEGETTELAWLRPADAIDGCRRGAILLPPPTWTTLKGLARYRSAREAEAWARTTSIVRVQPRLIRDGREAILTLPGDPSYPAVAGWEVPEDTRFVLKDGQWRPVHA